MNLKNIILGGIQKLGKPSKTNKKKQVILDSIDNLPDVTFNDAKDLINISFKYFCVNQIPVGQQFSDWTEKLRLDLLQKLAELTKYTRNDWKLKKSNGLPLLAEYGKFPINTDFTIPSNIPNSDEIIWSRFRLMQKVRVCGFFVTETIAKQYDLSINTFYVVFLWIDHRFYKTENE